MNALQAIDDFLAALLPGWVIQYGQWMDEQDKSLRYVVIRPAGGALAELLRRPQFTVLLIGGAADPLPSIAQAADEVVEAMRAGSGALTYLEASEPAFMATEDRRPVFQIAVSAITN